MGQTVWTRFFRAGVGTVLYTKDGNVAIFKRATPPVGIWQFQQGGIDAGEAPQTTLWRELKEEVGLTPTDIKTVEYPDWTLYEDTEAQSDTTKQRLGQTHRWFFLELTSAHVIDLDKATEKELSAYELVSFDQAITLTSPNKKAVYEKLHDYFKNHVLQTVAGS